jgi:hypothetical protein
MFVHSLWSRSPLPVEQASSTIRDQLGFEMRGDATEFFMLDRLEQAESADFDGAWMTPASNVASHRVVVYVLDPQRLPLPGPRGSIIGAVSDLPALNSVIMDELQSVTYGKLILPNLERNRVANQRVYEARIATSEGERSITYTDPEHATSRFLEDWASNASLTAATIRHDPGVLLTAFSDGQIWLQGAAPDRVPEVVTNTVSYLWPSG